MLNSFRKLLTQNRNRHLRSLLFFILFYLYIWLEVDTRLIYQGAGAISNFPVFFKDWTFFQRFTSYPGGTLEYLCALLSQFLYIGWAGALILTLQAWLLSLCTDYLFKAVNLPRLRCLRFVPPVLLLITYTRYTYHFATTTALLVSLLSVCLYLTATQKAKLPRLIVFLVLSVFVYTIAGGAYLLFALLCAIYELLFTRRRRFALVYLLSAAVIPCVGGVLVFDVSIIDAFTNLLPVSWKVFEYENYKKILIIVSALYLFAPAVLLISGLCRSFFIPHAQSPNQPNAPKTRPHKPTKKKRGSKSSGPLSRILSWYTGSPVIKWFVESSLLFVLTGAVIFFSRDIKKKALFETDFYASRRMWPKVLETAAKHPNSYYIVHAVNRALYHTGRMPYDLFRFYQNPDTLFLTAAEHRESYFKKFDLFLDLGHINMAEHELTESLAADGWRTMILKRLALANIAKRTIHTARVYLSALSKTFFDADWATGYLQQLQSDPTFTLPADHEIQRLRRYMPVQDYGFSPMPFEHILLDLLKKNTRNRMAFEYLMSSYLLTGQLDKFVQNLHRLDDFDYTQIPPLYEEAILLYMHKEKKAVDLHGRQISRLSRQRFEDFKKVYAFYGGNKEAAFQSLANAYGGTFFFYSTYGLSGLKK
jgi:hypothetical protein